MCIEAKKTCKICPADISHRNGNAVYCIDCELAARRERERARRKKKTAPRLCLDCSENIDHMHHRATRCPTCKVAHKRNKAREKMRARRKDRPGQPIRAISPLTEELGHLSGGCTKERKQRPQLPPPNLAKAQYVVKIGKTTYFPRTEKRYKELLSEKQEKERATA